MNNTDAQPSAEQPPDDDGEQEWVKEVGTGFSIKDDASANWLVLRVMESRAYATRCRAWATAEIARAEKREKRLMQWYGNQLENWLRLRLVEQRHGKCVRLPAGTVGLRRRPPCVSIVDEGELIQWCRTNLLEAIQIQVRAAASEAEALGNWVQQNCVDGQANWVVAKAPLNAHVGDTGEVPPGTVIEDAVDRMFIAGQP